MKEKRAKEDIRNIENKWQHGRSKPYLISMTLNMK